MPTAGTHITIVQRLALSGLTELGDPDPSLPETDPNAAKMRYACLGACGPDIFYAMADYGGGVQDLENFLLKIAGTFECIAELMGKVDRYVSGLESEITGEVSDSIKHTFDLVNGVIKEWFLAALVNTGINLWPVFEPARQKDDVREKWFWADYLHYIRTGVFTHNLLENSKGNDNLHAYALGYLTHYVTDVVGHPYVNQVVQAPWRLYWQRHHLVENFIDTYVWDRWHKSSKPPIPPSTEEQPLDETLSTPNPIGTGAPFTFARLNDWIKVGHLGVGDPVDDLVDNVCKTIEAGLFDLGVVEEIEPTPPTEADFVAWTQLMAKTIRQTYADDRHPMNLATLNLPGGGTKRPDGYPTAEDVGAAYGVFRLIMRITTEEKIQPPKPPDLLEDISDAVQRLLDDISKDLGSVPPVPVPATGGSFSLEALLDALLKAAEWVAEAAEAVGKAVTDFVTDAIAGATAVVTYPIRYALYLLNLALFSLYRSFRDVLVLQAYAVPFTEELSIKKGDLDFSTLWRSLGDLPAGQYPREEISAERARINSSYHPATPPSAPAELPPVLLTAPYKPRPLPSPTGGFLFIPTFPDDFIDAPALTRRGGDMFRETGPEPPVGSPPSSSFDAKPRNFGGAMANSRNGIALVKAGFPRGATLPDYNLDGDRGYAWPCWDVDPPPAKPPPDFLNPDMYPGNVATVNAIEATG